MSYFLFRGPRGSVRQSTGPWSPTSSVLYRFKAETYDATGYWGPGCLFSAVAGGAGAAERILASVRGLHRSARVRPWPPPEGV